MGAGIESLDQLYELFYITTYGCNHRLESKIKETLEKNRQPNKFVFHEYFFHQPLSKEMPIPEDGYLLAPFAIRMIENSLLIPEVTQDDKGKWSISSYKHRQDDYGKSTQIIVSNESLWLTRAAFARWAKKSENESSSLTASETSADNLNKKAFEREEELGLTYKVQGAANSHKEWVGIFSKFSPSIFEEVAKNHQTNSDGTPDNITNRSRQLQNGFMKLIYPEESQNTKFVSLFVPIASSHIFYGAVWFKFPITYEDIIKENNLITFEKIGFDISSAINEIYVPTLALLHNNIYENLVSSTESKNILSDFKINNNGSCCKYKNVYLEIEPLNLDKEKFSEPIEQGFTKLWRKRKKSINSYATIKDDELIFRNYLVCSERMIGLTRKVIEDAESIKADDKCLPSLLVIGGAGSGKDTFAKMPALFSDSFYAGKRYILNMASLKPAPLVSGMVTGVEATINCANGQSIQYNFKGMLQKIRERTIASKPENLKAHNAYPIIVLDELNSMDIDSQGVLLRFLENGEMIPLGGIEDTELDTKDLTDKYGKVDIKILNCCLVVGVMNEDPDDLSREKAMDFIREESYLGGLLGDFLYEKFTKMRRLRPDIKYRMSRNGKYKLPMLRERRDDIPLLFYVFCKSELKERLNKEKNFSLHVTLEAFNFITSENLLWRGNVRELQALAKRVISCVLKDKKYSVSAPSTIESYTISHRDVKQGLIDLEIIKE